MARRRVMIEMREQVSAGMLAKASFEAVSPVLAGIQFDPGFQPVEVPSRTAIEQGQGVGEVGAAFGLGTSPKQSNEQTYLLRGTLDDEAVSVDALAASAGGEVVGVYADVAIQPFITCIGTPAVGDDRQVEGLLAVARLKSLGMTGRDVCVAIVDTGINLPYLNSHGKNPRFDAARSWVPRPGLEPGKLPVSHGTMCAFDACIAAPECTLLDIAVLLSQTPGGSAMEGLLSDAVRAYAHLRTILRGPGRPRALVVSNSWGMFHPSWDFPVGHPGNYSDNPAHPFNRIVGTLEREGADILFAAGNCGNECPDGRCGNVTNAIYGANSHPKVLSVAGVDVHQDRVGYSTKGPGRLTANKPDLAGYTHFKGSGVYPMDGGTSAATPVVAGVVAALRTRFPYKPLDPLTWPRVMRELLRQTATDRGTAGYDREYGWGVVNPAGMMAALMNRGLASTGPDEPSPAAPPEPAPGETTEEPVTYVSSAAAAVGNLNTLFLRLSVPAQPGRNVHRIVGLPTGTRAVSIWVTEWVGPNNPHAGDAVFSTSSVQLFDDGRGCRFVYNSSWGSPLPAAVQMIYGPA